MNTIEHNLEMFKTNPVYNFIPDDMKRWLITTGFFKAPASTKYHGDYEGGLFNHSRIVTEVLVELTNKNGLEWSDPRSPYIVGMFHDLCKIDSYKGSGCMWEYNSDVLLGGHGDKSVMLLSQFMTLTIEEILCIRYHMGAFTDKEEWKHYSKAVDEFPNVLWTHTADMIASKLFKT